MQRAIGRSLLITLALVGASCSGGSEQPPATGVDAGGGDSRGGSGGSGGDGSVGGGTAGSAGSATGNGGLAAGGSAGSLAGGGGASGSAGVGGASGGGSGKVACGTGKAMVPSDGSTEGVVIAPDGTIYHSQSFSGDFISRIRPGMAEEREWVMVGATVLGITFDPKRNALYAGSRSRGKILKIQVDALPPAVTELADAELEVNGLTLGEDDAVYYTDQGSGHVFRVAPDGSKTPVTTAPIPDGPNGLAFGPDGWLYVNSWEGEDVWRLQVNEAGQETMRELFASVGRDNSDGIAFDELGRMYVTAGGELHQFDGDGQLMTTMPSGGANLDFGAGALSCNDVYVGGNNGGLEVHTLEVKGMDVPWHRMP